MPFRPWMALALLAALAMAGVGIAKQGAETRPCAGLAVATPSVARVGLDCSQNASGLLVASIFSDGSDGTSVTLGPGFEAAPADVQIDPETGLLAGAVPEWARAILRVEQDAEAQHVLLRGRGVVQVEWPGGSTSFTLIPADDFLRVEFWEDSACQLIHVESGEAHDLPLTTGIPPGATVSYRWSSSESCPSLTWGAKNWG